MLCSVCLTICVALKNIGGTSSVGRVGDSGLWVQVPHLAAIIIILPSFIVILNHLYLNP